MSGFTITSGVSFSGAFTFTEAAVEAAWFGGGYVSGGPALSTVQRITYATDTATASVRGPLSLSIGALGAAGGIQ